MVIELVLEAIIVSIIRVCAPKIGCTKDKKNVFWRNINEVMQQVPENEKIIIESDLNENLGEGKTREGKGKGCWGFGQRNGARERTQSLHKYTI